MNGNKIFAGKETFQRMNYLYQISHHLMEKCHQEETKTNKKCLEYISNYYSALLTTIGKKSQLRMGSDMKRTLCKGCQRILMPGKTARVRLRKKPQHHTRWTCLHCGSYRTFIMKKDYQLWSENPEAVLGAPEKALNKEDVKKKFENN